MSEPAQELLESLARASRARLDALGEGSSAARLAALLELGRALAALGAPDADGPLRGAIDAAESLRERAASRVAAIELGAWLAARGDGSLGRAHLERALDAARRGKDPGAKEHAALAAAELALLLAHSGDATGAAAALASARAAAAPGAARVELRAGDVARRGGDLATAREAYGRALEASRSGDDPLERAGVELAASEALARLATAPPGARELGLLTREDLAALVEATALVARADPGSRALMALDAALRFTGCSGGELREGGRVLATAGTPGENVFEVRQGERRLVLAAKAARPGPREDLLARAILAHVATEGEPPASGAVRVLAMLDRVLAAGLELERLVTVATDLAVEATGAGRGFLLLREPGSKLGFRAARRGGDDLVDPAGIVSRSLVREVFLSGHALLLADAASDPERGDVESVGSRGLRSVLVAPIPAASEDEAALGVLYLDDPGAVGRFGPAEREVAVGFAARLGPPLRAVLERESEQKAAASARSALSRPQTRPPTRHPYPEIVGHGRAIGQVLLLLDRAVESSAPVLISGESGTGKELVARALHANGPRAKGPFEAISCAALADSVLESELFGHAAGAFTGAAQARKGIFEQAHGGTIFLDELQEASKKLQGDLLRVLEAREVRPVGADAYRKVDVRLVAATNADLASLVAAGSFREDLYYRVNVIHIALPPLRERVEDIPELVEHFLRAATKSKKPRALAAGVLERLAAFSWPGNVRALKHCLDRALVLAGEGPVLPEHVVLEGPTRPPARTTDRTSVYAGTIELNERQLSLVERLRAEGSISNVEHSEREGVSQPTGWRDLVELVAKGVLAKSGRGKKTIYTLAPGWEARLGGG